MKKHFTFLFGALLVQQVLVGNLTAKNKSLTDLSHDARTVTLSDENVTETADIQAHSMSLANRVFFRGATVKIRVDLYNESSSNENIFLGYYLSKDTLPDAGDIVLAKTAIVSISRTPDYFEPMIRIDSSTAEGRYYLIVKADDRNDVQETNENNNIVYRSIQVGSEDSDLVLSFTDTTSASVKQRDEFLFDIRSENKGRTVADFYMVNIFLAKDSVLGDHDLLTTTASLGLDSAESETFSMKVYISERVAPGDYYLIAYTDGDGESSTAARKIKVLPLDNDFTVSVSNAGNSEVMAGENFTLNAVVRNEGSDEAFAQVIVFYLSADTLVDTTDVVAGVENITSLGANGSVTLQPALSVPDTLSAGQYYLVAQADKVNEWQETDETNNIGYTPITVKRVVTGFAGVSDENQKIVVYPNPTNGLVRFSSALADEAEVTGVTETSSFNLSKGPAGGELDLSGFEPGVYHIRIKSKGAVISEQRVVLTR